MCFASNYLIFLRLGYTPSKSIEGVCGFMWALICIGTVLFAIAGAAYWLVTGHRPPIDVVFFWLTYCGFIVYVKLDVFLESWRKESKETANNVREILHRVERLESTLDLARKD